MNRRDPHFLLLRVLSFFSCVVDPVSLLFTSFSHAHFLHGAPPLPSPQPPPWCTKGTEAAPRAGRGGQAAGPGVRRPRLEDHRPDPTGPPVRPLQRHVGPPGRAQAPAAGLPGCPPRLEHDRHQFHRPLKQLRSLGKSHLCQSASLALHLTKIRLMYVFG